MTILWVAAIALVLAFLDHRRAARVDAARSARHDPLQPGLRHLLGDSELRHARRP